MTTNYDALPEAMRVRNQWCVADANKAPTLLNGIGFYGASPVTGPWHTFQDACRIASEHNMPLGYVITPDDGLVCIDMDVADSFSIKNGKPVDPSKYTNPEQLQNYCNIVAASNSYSELSLSGKGLHTWVRAEAESGRRNNGIEVYPRDRFIICTGNAVSDLAYHTINNVAIPMVRERVIKRAESRQQLVASLIHDIMVQRGSKSGTAAIPLVEIPQQMSDDDILAMARRADNKDKFIALWVGDWKLFHGSQSEGDYSLMGMLSFYSPSNEQCRRLFLQSALGKRSKCTLLYMDRTLTGLRANQAAKEQQLAHIDTAALMETQRLRNEAAAAPPPPTTISAADTIAAMQEAAQTEGEADAATPLPDTEGLPWPPGVVGDLAAFVYRSSPRPVKEVAIVAALGFFAGVCGLSYHTESKSGLNLYIILIARSAIGKEAMHTGLGLLLNNLGEASEARKFVDFADHASGPALIRTCSENPSFLNVSGEWGRKLRRLAMEDGRDGPMQQLRTVMTNLYQKSGPGSVVGGTAYSKKDVSVDSMKAVAYSMIGESTPGTFYESLTDSMMEDGFLSRFSIVEYSGERPDANNNQQHDMHPSFSTYLGSVCAYALRLNSTGQSITVNMDDASRAMFAEYDKRCDLEINKAGYNETVRQMWNRAHLKALRIACLLAVADNYLSPVTQAHHAEWALDMVNRDVMLMGGKITNGDIGNSDRSRLGKLNEVIKSYVTIGPAKGYRVNKKLVDAGVVPLSYLFSRLSMLGAFSGHRLGAAMAIKITITAAIDCGYIVEDLEVKDGRYGKLYKAMNLS